MLVETAYWRPSGQEFFYILSMLSIAHDLQGQERDATSESHLSALWTFIIEAALWHSQSSSRQSMQWHVRQVQTTG